MKNTQYKEKLCSKLEINLLKATVDKFTNKYFNLFLYFRRVKYYYKALNIFFKKISNYFHLDNL